MQSDILFLFPSILVSRVRRTCRYGACCPRDIQLFLAHILVIHLVGRCCIIISFMTSMIQLVHGYIEGENEHFSAMGVANLECDIRSWRTSENWFTPPDEVYNYIHKSENILEYS